jgi:DNA-directed RNA polymerase subunit F
MVIKEETPITLAEVYDLVKNNERTEDMKNFLSNFKPLQLKKATELKKELQDLNLIKLKDSHIVKIVDFLPKDATELNKILTDVSLDEAELNQVLDVVKKY